MLLRGWQGRSWLEAAEGDSYVCRACVMHAKGKSALATPGMVTSVKWGNFRRHAQGKLHEACVRKLLGAKNAELPEAPTTRQFQELWKAIRQARSAQKQENSKTKALDMLWCLYEAMRLKDEEFLTQPGVVIALHRDERNRVIQCDFLRPVYLVGGAALRLQPGWGCRRPPRHQGDRASCSHQPRQAGEAWIRKCFAESSGIGLRRRRSRRGGSFQRRPPTKLPGLAALHKSAMDCKRQSARSAQAAGQS